MKLIWLLTGFCCFAAVASTEHLHSKYMGEESRRIKSLSESDIDDLANGRGWGLAKAAELNGVPGPAHLLEMKKEIGLSSEQIEKITHIYRPMQDEAKGLGLQLIGLEKELNELFAQNKMDEQTLKNYINQIANVRAKLRFVHLSTHLKMPAILTSQQLTRYSELRGYTNDVCSKVPAGHDEVMWKKHNGCNN
jgi:Spy/CpxP family protein refolding chaperone